MPGVVVQETILAQHRPWAAVIGSEEAPMSANEIIDRYEQTWAERDTTGMVACFAPGGTYNAPGADHLHGPAIGEFAAIFFTACPDSTYEWKTAAVDGDTVAVEWRFSGTMTGPLMDIAPTGGRGSARGAHIIRLSGGKVASVEAFWDNQDFFAQLGIKG
jgi:predicted ester cyclase